MKDPMEFLMKNEELNANIIDFIKYDKYETVYSEDDGVMIMNTEFEDFVPIFFLTVESGEAAAKIVRLIKRPKYNIIINQNEYTPFVLEALGLTEENTDPYNMFVYEGKEELPLVNVPGIDIRPLTMGDYNFVCKTYDSDKGYIVSRLKKGMLGAFDNGKCVGFIGIHNDGSIGLLEVIPQYRKRGIGKALMIRLINKTLKENKVPFTHVKFGNIPSEKLHESLGFKKMDGSVCWIYNYV